jgi:hypothetical protein
MAAAVDAKCKFVALDISGDVGSLAKSRRTMISMLKYSGSHYCKAYKVGKKLTSSTVGKCRNVSTRSVKRHECPTTLCCK